MTSAPCSIPMMEPSCDADTACGRGCGACADVDAMPAPLGSCTARVPHAPVRHHSHLLHDVRPSSRWRIHRQATCAAPACRLCRARVLRGALTRRAHAYSPRLAGSDPADEIEHEPARCRVLEEKINLLENSRKKLHGRCLELLGALTMTRARVHELETLLYLKHMDKEVGLPSPFAHFSDC